MNFSQHQAGQGQAASRQSRSRSQGSSQKTQAPKNLYSQYEEKVRPCIDLIDSLRALGVEQDMALPAIAVIGDQSSGKSSVLEALSGVALPRGSGIVTRCPLVLKLRKLTGGSWSGKVTYRNTQLKLEHPSQVEKEICRAQDLIAGRGVGISHELISVDISSPEVPDLTLIDLPGITRVPVGDQPQDIGLKVKTLIQKYIQRQQTINLVVVPCNVDIATTEALSMAREVDPEGDRTIGILTKPDLVDKGTESSILRVAQNYTYRLKKGYLMVRCRGQQDIANQLSLAEATEKETKFFQDHPYFRILLDEGKATVSCLAERLTSELILHINKMLPFLDEQIQENYQRATEELCLYGANIPSSDADMLLFLIEKIRAFNRHIERLVEGEEVPSEKEARLCNRIRENFNNWGMVILLNTDKVKNIMHEEISKYENKYRGKELIGFVNYKTFEIIVQQYIEHLLHPALETLQKVTEMIRQTFVDTAKSHFGEFFNLNQIVQKLIEDIKVKQMEIVDDQIRLQFKMERQVYCQDHIYGSILGKVREETFNPMGKLPVMQSKAPNNSSTVSSVNEIGLHLNAYFLEASQRLANQIPLIIRFFMLQEYGECLQKSMMQILQDKQSYSWLLQEQNETMLKRKFLKDKISRLDQARQALCKFYHA
ncbi:interferon-induced GTP-binding protein Mx2 [Sorex fumeus]|uniref:interferon-induced GTP-binding protein Mx2 n=1 Tax=Sorex fumeus TaxID=62283 RepID=UPI0024AE4BFC|nr:interferon-induced GTP-binding protein Mx2 [Sorex fumeus]XP_055975543.1 interferon-induced GTP-binding protein Mx2 [Sorex fumeus]